MKITSIGDRIALARKELGLSQSQVAEITGYSKNTICRLEKSHSVADVNQITKIGDLLKQDLAWLITGKEGSRHQTGDAIPVFRTISDKIPQTSESEGFLNFPGLGDCDFAVINDSPAMSPRLPEGCLLAIRITDVEDGQLAAITDEWGVFQVRWQRSQDGKPFFVAENTQYPPMEKSKVKVIGRVVSSVQIHNY